MTLVYLCNKVSEFYMQNFLPCKMGQILFSVDALAAGGYNVSWPNLLYCLVLFTTEENCRVGKGISIFSGAPGDQTSAV